jgi:hypothetical protein
LRSRKTATLNDEDSMHSYIVLVALVALAPSALAQQRAPQPHPADPAAKAPAVKYESAFAGYTPFREEKLAPWREVNDDVGKARGHAGIFGGAGRAGHAIDKAAQPKPATSHPDAGKSADPEPARDAPKAPAAGHKGH